MVGDTWRAGLLLGGSLTCLFTLIACASGEPGAAPPGPPPSPSAARPTGQSPGRATGGTTTPRSGSTRPGSSAAAATSSTTPAEPPAGTVPPPWLGTRPLPLTDTGYGEIRPTPPELRERRFTLPDRLPPLPGRGFAARVVSPPPAAVVARSTYESGCPVGVDELAWVRLTFRGFDGARHTGELLTNASVAADLVQVFHDLWDADFPIEEMRIASRADLDAAPTGDGNATGSFVCRPVVGETTFSQHASGLAVDVDSFQNPYLNERAGDGSDRIVLPELASSYLDRDDVRPGMITPDGPVVAAFDRIGWTWGGTWRTKKDYQHFSLTGG